MAEETITILRVDTKEAVRSINDLRDNIKALKEQVSGLDIGSEQYKKTLTELVTNQNALRNAMNATTASMSDVAKAATGAANANTGMADTYNGLVAQMANMRREIRNVNVSTAEGMEEFKRQAAEIAKVNAKLKEMDALTGNYQRNVGNYRSAFNGLNNAMAQVVREAPAAAISMNTFFLAISNNIPILADQIGMLREQNRLAAEKGEQTVSVIKALVKSFFSWNTVMTAVIVVFTMFGDKILSFIGNLFKGKKAVDDMTTSLNEMKEAMDTDSIGSQIANYRSLAQMYREIGDNAEEKRKFIEEYREEIDKTGVSVKNIYDADKLFIDNADEFETAVKQRAMALAGMELAAEQYKKAVEQSVQDEDDLSSARRGRAQAYAQYQQAENTYGAYKNFPQYGRIIDAYKRQYQDMDAMVKEIEGRTQAFVKAGDQYIDASNALNREADKVLNLDEEQGGTGGGSSATSTDNTLELLRKREDARIALMEEGMLKDLELNRVNYERQIEDLKIQLETEENLTETGRQAIMDTIVYLTEKQEQEKLQIIADYNQRELEEYQKLEDEISRQEAKSIKDSFKEEERQNRQTATENSGKLAAVDKGTQQRLADNKSTIGQKAWEEQENEYKIIQEGNQRKLDLLNQFAQDALEAGNLDGYLEYQQQVSDLSVEMQQKENEEKKRLYEQDKNARVQTMQAVASSTSSILNSIADMYEANGDDSEKAANQVKNIRIAAATIDTISGAIGAYMQATATIPPPAGVIVGAVQAAAVIAAGMAQIAQIRNTKVDKDSAPSTTPAVVSAPTLNPEVSQVRNVTSASEEERFNRMAGDQRVYILQSDIEAADNRRKVQVEESSF